MPILNPACRSRRPRKWKGIRELDAVDCVTLMHKGPYEQLGHVYEKVIAHINENGWEIQLPIREVYLKGPGMIFKGNPKNYLTEIQVPVKR